MSQAVIRVEGVGKRYKLGVGQASYATLRDLISRVARSPFGRTRNPVTELWAVRDVSFEIAQGEVVGIIGRNGAGKSTLLKILSRITEPSKGRITISGRVGALLEVGTGFHPELTGRENIFLNGSILGMRRAEIARKFDEIVAFAEVERFLDTPVKFYSSGMYVRLAFAVAAHLEPEVLLVDEVLAVGDASFQRKCLNKMEQVGASGRTVLFVSHNMPAVTRICPRTILIEAGTVAADGPSSSVVSRYLSSELGTSAERAWAAATAPGNDVVRLLRVRVVDHSGETADAIDIRRSVGVEMTYQVFSGGDVLIPNLHFYNEEGDLVFILQDTASDWRRTAKAPGIYVSTVWIPGNTLSEGTLIVGAAVSTHQPLNIHFFERDAVAFHVTDTLDGDSVRGDYAGLYPGAVRPMFPWSTERIRDNHGLEAAV